MQKRENNINIRRWGLKLLLVLFDIFAVNISYYMALVLRFYVNGEFHLAGTLYLPLLVKFAPYYTVCCIAVFWFFKLYNGIWRYAGPSDIRRIVGASAVTCLIQILGTLLFIRRMPSTYYAIGAAIQFLLITISRFSYRICAEEFGKFVRRSGGPAVNLMIVGAGETARIFLSQLESAEDNLVRPVCVVDSRSRETGRLFDGLPVVGGLDAMEEAVAKYGVKSVVIADSLIQKKARCTVRELCKKLGLSVQDFSTYMQSVGSELALSKLMEVTDGPIEILCDGRSCRFENGEQAAAEMLGRYMVRLLSAKDGLLRVEVEADAAANGVSEAWIQDYEKETGEQVSFF